MKEAALRTDISLQPHQEKIQKLFQDNPEARVYLMHALGSGKSLSGLAAAESSGEPYTFLSPASLRQNVQKEREKFTDQQTPMDAMSYSEAAMGKPVDKLNTLVADEAHNLRNPKSQRAQRVIDLATRAKRLVLLSGTPAVNRPSDFAVPMSMLTQKNITPDEFTNRYVGDKKTWPGLLAWLRGVPRESEPTLQNTDELKELLKGKIDYYAPDKESVPVNRKDMVSQMSGEQTRLYKAMWDELPWLLKWKLKHDYQLSDEELKKAQGFLTGPRQVSLSTYPYQLKKDPYKAYQQSGKLQQAMGLLQEKLKQDPRTKALVFSNFIDAGLTPYSSALTKANIPHGVFHGGLSDIERRKLVEDYNTDKLRVALLGPSGSEGLSFKGTQLLQLLDPHWNQVRPKQSEGRGIRYDSHFHLPEELQNVEVQRFISRLPPGFKERLLNWVGRKDPNSGKAVDEHLLAMSERKDKLNQEFVSLLKQIGSGKEASNVLPIPEQAIKSESRYDHEPVRSGNSISANNRTSVLPDSDSSYTNYSSVLVRKEAEEKEDSRKTPFTPEMISAGLPAVSSAIGAMSAADTGSPLQDKLRGGLKGLGAGSGAALAALLARAISKDNIPAQIASGAAGGGLGYYLTSKAIGDELQGNSPPKPMDFSNLYQGGNLDQLDEENKRIPRPVPMFIKRWQQVRPIQTVPY